MKTRWNFTPTHSLQPEWISLLSRMKSRSGGFITLSTVLGVKTWKKFARLPASGWRRENLQSPILTASRICRRRGAGRSINDLLFTWVSQMISNYDEYRLFICDELLKPWAGKILSYQPETPDQPARMVKQIHLSVWRWNKLSVTVELQLKIFIFGLLCI